MAYPLSDTGFVSLRAVALLFLQSVVLGRSSGRLVPTREGNRSSIVGWSSGCFDRLAQSLRNEHSELTGKRHDRFPVGEFGVS